MTAQRITWRLAPVDVAKECEKRFQNGGTKVYAQDKDGTLRWTTSSAKRAVEHAFPGQKILARRKVAHRYEWRVAHVTELTKTKPEPKKHNPGGQCDLCEGQCLDQPVHPRPIGRPPGSKTGLRPGSRPYQIAQLKVGERLTLTVPTGKRVTSYMGQIGADIGRANMRGRVKQQHAMFIIVATREVSDVIVLECVQ